MRRALLAVALTVALSVGATTTAHADPVQRCQYDTDGRTLIVLPAPHTAIGATVWVQRTTWSPHHWRHVGYVDSRRVVTIRLQRPAHQTGIRVRVDSHRCETT